MSHATWSSSIATRKISTWARRIGAAITLVAASTASLSAQDAAGVTQWIRAHLEPINSSTADSSVRLSALANIVSGARIVGLGESVHHTHELLELRSRLTRELVERHNYRAVAMETGYADALLLESWLREPSAAEPDLALALPYAHDGEYEEIRDALRWMKRYNSAQPPERRVRFIGIDLSNGGGALRPPFERVWEYLDQLEPDVARASRDRLVPVLERLGSGYSRTAKQRFDSLSNDDRALLDRELVSLREQLARRRTANERSSYAVERDRASHALDVATQTLGFLRSDPRDPTNPRDHALASNVEWALASLPADTKLIVWAHNAHVQKQPIDVPQMNMARPAISMGELLSERFGGGYRAIGTAVDRLAPDSTRADSASVDAMLASAGAPAFLLGLRGADERAPVPAWFRRAHPMRFESLYLRTIPALAFDAIVFTTSAAPGTLHRP